MVWMEVVFVCNILVVWKVAASSSVHGTVEGGFCAILKWCQIPLRVGKFLAVNGTVSTFWVGKCSHVNEPTRGTWGHMPPSKSKFDFVIGALILILG